MGSRRPSGKVHGEIMGATYRALCANGYANLSMRNIAAEFDKSKSLLYYHFDTKEELMLAFLDHVIGWVPARLEESETEAPEERLVEFVDRFVIDPEEERREGFALALFELRMAAVHNDVFREKLTSHYHQNEAALEAVLEDGVAAGVFPPLDPQQTATWAYAALEGARMRQVVLGVDGATARVAEGLLVQLLDDADRRRIG